MIKNKYKKIISIGMLLGMIVTTFPVNVYAGGCLSRMNGYEDISLKEKLSSLIHKSGRCGGGDVKYQFKRSTGELTLLVQDVFTPNGWNIEMK